MEMKKVHEQQPISFQQFFFLNTPENIRKPKIF